MLSPVENAPLAPHCTLRIGGPARYLVEATDEATVAEAVEWASARRLPVRVLGGGSNLVIADEGVDGLVLKIALRGVSTRDLPGAPGAIEVTAAAGEPWDGLVRHVVERGWAGLECLSGIPGLVGATPIQNVGAYGQGGSQTGTGGRASDRRKSGLGRRGIAKPSLADVRASVLAIRRSKSMVLDPDDPNRRSCGSFFLNPVVDGAMFEGGGRGAGGPSLPRWGGVGG